MNVPLKDEELVHLYLNTQQDDYFRDLYDRYVSKVYRRCLSLTKDAVQAQDFTQDIFMRVLTRLDRFQERSTFSTWLYAISYNYCMDQLGARKRLRMVSLDEMSLQCADESDSIAQIEDQLVRLTSVMNQINARELKLLAMRYEEGLSIDVIARQLQLKESAVKMRLKRTRDKLRELYHHDYLPDH